MKFRFALFSSHAYRTLMIVALFGGLFMSVSAQSDETTQQAVELFNQGQDAHQKGDYEAAIKFYEKAIELIPEFPEAEMQRGTALLALKRLDEAERSFRRAVELREGWTLAMTNLGSLLVDRGKLDEAEKLLTAAIAADEGNVSALTALADLKLKTKADEPSLRAILSKLSNLAAKVRPTVPMLTAKAAVEIRLRDFNAAKASVAKALAADPKSTPAVSIATDIALRENDLDAADRYIRQLEGVVPEANETKSLKARLLFAKGKKADALSLLGSIKDPDESAKSMIAEIKEGDVADLAGLEAKIQRTPNDPNVLSKLCDGFRVSHPAKAIEYCRRASIAEPNELRHAVGFGAALVQAKQYEEAIGLFRKLLTIAPEHATIRANLATALFQLKRYPEARSEFRWLSEKQPDSPAAFYFLGIVHDQLGEYLDAMANYQQFLKLANAESDKVDIEKVQLRLPAVQKFIRNGKGKKRE